MADKTASGSGGSSAQDSSKKVGLIGLVGIVISAMIGGGIYNLPQNMAADASAGAIIIAWVVTGIGIWFIANTFRILSAARPELTNGLYTYAEKGFGKLIGFFVAYGYWICNCFALVAYSVLVMATLNYFVPDFTGGNNIPSIIGGSIITWIMYLLALRGAKSTSFLNIIGTIGKLLPVFIFILAVATVFKFSVFMEGFWGMKDGVALTLDFSNVMPQVSSTMLVTLWLFLGIEGAVAISGRAKKDSDVGKATVIAFVCVLTIYLLVSTLSMGVMPLSELSELSNPALAGVMERAVGPWGATLINGGVVLSLVGAMLGYTVLSAECPYEAAAQGGFVKAFARVNKKGAPIVTLVVTNLIIEVFLVIMLFSESTYQFFYALSAGMILLPYLLSAAYFAKVAFTEADSFKGKLGVPVLVWRVFAVLGVIYSVFLAWASGAVGVTLMSILYAPGILLYIKGKKERSQPFLENTLDRVVAAVILIAAVVSIGLLVTGTVSI